MISRAHSSFGAGVSGITCETARTALSARQGGQGRVRWGHCHRHHQLTQGVRGILKPTNSRDQTYLTRLRTVKITIMGCPSLSFPPLERPQHVSWVPSGAELTCVDVAQDAECDGNIDLVYDEFLSQGAEKSI